MICGLGTDIIEISRIKSSLERFDMRFVEKILTPEEVTYLRVKYPNFHTNFPVHSIAARFAAKEAAVKALGTGFSQGITLQHIAVLNQENGKPHLKLYGPALEEFHTLGATQSHISISHSRDTACAVVILEKICI